MVSESEVLGPVQMGQVRNLEAATLAQCFSHDILESRKNQILGTDAKGSCEKFK